MTKAEKAISATPRWHRTVALVAEGARRLSPSGGSIVRVETPQRAVALTFDDGPDAVYTPAVLTLLREHGAKATFFLVGERAASHPDIVARIVADGHDVASHGWQHLSTGNGTLYGGLRAELRLVRRGVEALEPFSPRFYRPPFGHQSRWTRLAAKASGLTVVGWSDSPRDWEHVDAETLRHRLRNCLRPGGIMLLHDGLENPQHPNCSDRTNTVDAVGHLLETERDWQFVSLTQLLTLGRPIRRLRRPRIVMVEN